MSSNCQSAWGSVGVEALRRRTRLEVDADSSSNVLAQSLISKSRCQSRTTLSICLLLTTSNKLKHNVENSSDGNQSNNADLGEMDDVGRQSSSNKAVRGVWVVQEPDLQRN